MTDRGSVHQDHAVALRGVCASLAAAKPAMSREAIRFCLRSGRVDETHEDPLYRNRDRYTPEHADMPRPWGDS